MSQKMQCNFYRLENKSGRDNIGKSFANGITKSKTVRVFKYGEKGLITNNESKAMSSALMTKAGLIFALDKSYNGEELYNVLKEGSSINTAMITNFNKDIPQVYYFFLENLPEINKNLNEVGSIIRCAYQAIKRGFSAQEFSCTYHLTSKKYYYYVLFMDRTELDSHSPNYNYNFVRIDDLAEAKRANEVEIIYKGSILKTQMVQSTSAGNDPDQNTGFFLGAGYYERQQIGPTAYNGIVVQDTNKYIGVSVSKNSYGYYLSTSNIADDPSSIRGYSSIYQLYNDIAKSGNAPYYTLYSGSDISDDGGGGSGGSTNVSVQTITLDPIILPEIDYSVAAELDMNKYIYDYIIQENSKTKTYRPHFIPFTKKNEEDKDEIKYEMIETQMPIATFKNMEVSFGGEEYSRVKIQTDIVDEVELFTLLDKYNDKFNIKLSLISKEDGENTVSISDYFSDEKDNRGKYNFYYEYNHAEIKVDFLEYISEANKFLKNIKDEEKKGYTFDVTAILTQNPGILNLRSLELFEAKTRGRDFIEETYTTVRPKETETNNADGIGRLMTYDDNYFTYKYSGRDIDLNLHHPIEELWSIFQPNGIPLYGALIHDSDILLENDVTLGNTYGEREYFIEAIKIPEWKDEFAQIKEPTGQYNYIDTFKIKNYLEDGVDGTQYVEDDLEILTSKIDMTQCQYYYPEDASFENNWCDCRQKTGGKASTIECIYQKLGYCPYRFESEKHPRRIRSLRQSKSNRFNLIQELCKTFEFYPYFYIEHEKNGAVILNEEGIPQKHVFFMTEKGNTQHLGFRYEKNLSNMSRTLDSNQITTKLYVESVDSSLSDTGLCSIQTATDNISRNSYILDFSYYEKLGSLDPDQVQRDLYGIENGDFSFLTRIGELNKLYDSYSNLIINMTGEELTGLQAENDVATTGVITALEEKKKIGQKMYQFKAASTTSLRNKDVSYTTSDTYKNYLTKYREQTTILWGLIEKLLYSDEYFSFPVENKKTNSYDFVIINITQPAEGQNIDNIAEVYNRYYKNYCKGEFLWRLLIEGFENDDYVPQFDSWEDFQKDIIDEDLYPINGTLGKYHSLYNEVKYWKRERAKVLDKINDLSEQFYKKYEPFIKEGTFSDSNFLTDNEYYWGSVSVLADSCEPKITYTFSVIDISPLPEYVDDYSFELADTTYVEDIDFFGINKHTGFPNREKVLISTITEHLDNPSKNSIEVKNYTSSFSDLFGSITASVQSLTYNENIYKRASNFTALQYVTTESLQDTLDVGDLTLLDTAKSNILLDESGTEGNDIDNTASQYKITGEGVFFSTDGGETWDLGVGPKGMNLDYATIGNLDASKVQIVDGDYLYFLWDEDGINAYRDPSASVDGLKDFARFNRYGLSLIEKGNIRLRAGYEYISNPFGINETGNYEKEVELTNQNVGFYLYNDKGQPIFKTETQSNFNDDTTDYSARLSMTGEMFVTNKILSNTVRGGDTNLVYAYTLKGAYRFALKETITNVENKSSIGERSAIWSLLASQNSYSQNQIIILDENGNVLSDNEFNSDSEYQILQINSISQKTPTIDGYSNINEMWYTYYTEFQLSSDYENEEGQSFVKVKLTDQNIQTLLSGDRCRINVDNKEYDFWSSQNSNSPSHVLYTNSGESLEIYSTSQVRTLDSFEEDDTATYINPLPLQTLSYWENGKEKTEQLYYDFSVDSIAWKEQSQSDFPIDSRSNGYDLGEVAVFINNKKVLTDEEDRTNLFTQELTDDEDQRSKAMAAILSGAERVFSIVTRGEEEGSIVYKNILSILKNGVLYMGGTITDYYGKKLNLEDLSTLPDEVRIYQPSFILTNLGQIWCDWDKFFNMGYINGEWTLATVSLKTVIDTIISNINTIANAWNNQATGGSTQSGYYFDIDI